MRRFASADVDAAAAGDRDAAVRIAAVRAELRRVFLRVARAQPRSVCSATTTTTRLSRAAR